MSINALVRAQTTLRFVFAAQLGRYAAGLTYHMVYIY